MNKSTQEKLSQVIRERPLEVYSLVSDVPLLHERLNSHNTFLTFKDAFTATINPLIYLTEACDGVIKSRRFKTFSYNLYHVQKNYNKQQLIEDRPTQYRSDTIDMFMNMGILTTSNRTMIREAIEELVKTDEDAINVHQDLAACEKAATVDIDVVKKDIIKLRVSLDNVQYDVNKAKETKDNMAEIIEPYLKLGNRHFTILKAYSKKTTEKFNQFCTFLGYPQNEISKLTPKHVFGMLSRYAKNINDTKYYYLYKPENGDGTNNPYVKGVFKN